MSGAIQLEKRFHESRYLSDYPRISFSRSRTQPLAKELRRKSVCVSIDGNE